ncbi:hypothetical protein V6N11_049761 [Hibiscus sabdariffa]|uniref:Uncharacterized protein n=1 Tax=Hibiscus sabdariffa TaxID=183260 RepID=A0ABR2T8I3_9ROSI
MGVGGGACGVLFWEFPLKGAAMVRILEQKGLCLSPTVADVVGYWWRIGAVMGVMVGDCDDEDRVKVGGSLMKGIMEAR